MLRRDSPQNQCSVKQFHIPFRPLTPKQPEAKDLYYGKNSPGFSQRLLKESKYFQSNNPGRDAILESQRKGSTIEIVFQNPQGIKSPKGQDCNLLMLDRMAINSRKQLYFRPFAEEQTPSSLRQSPRIFSHNPKQTVLPTRSNETSNSRKTIKDIAILERGVTYKMLFDKIQRRQNVDKNPLRSIASRKVSREEPSNEKMVPLNTFSYLFNQSMVRKRSEMIDLRPQVPKNTRTIFTSRNLQVVDSFNSSGQELRGWDLQEDDETLMKF